MESLYTLSETLGESLTAKHATVTTVESCTGGGIAYVITDTAGSSGWFERAFVTYSNEAKNQMVGVKNDTLTDHGAVSENVALEMALGALAESGADYSLAVSGVAGPSGGTEEKPVGMVCFAWAGKDGWRQTETCYFDGNRRAVRHQTIAFSLNTLILHLKD